MFLELIATLFAGVAAAGVMLLLNKGVGGRLPKWLTPVAAGAAMLVATISSEYGWYGRTIDTLPDGLVIADTIESKAFYRPWTYLYPFVERFVAVDVATIQTHENLPDERLAAVYYFGRWAPVNRIAVLADCAGTRRAALTDGVEVADDGAITGADWVSVTDTDPILTTICKGA